MYLTQTSFFGKTGPIDPNRTISPNPAFADKSYPNRWMEDRNLRQLHKKSKSIFNLTQKGIKEDIKVNMANEKYAKVSCNKHLLITVFIDPQGPHC